MDFEATSLYSRAVVTREMGDCADNKLTVDEALSALHLARPYLTRGERQERHGLALH